MTSAAAYSLRPVGFVRSQLTVRADAPKQRSEGLFFIVPLSPTALPDLSNYQNLI